MGVLYSTSSPPLAGRVPASRVGGPLYSPDQTLPEAAEGVDTLLVAGILRVGASPAVNKAHFALRGEMLVRGDDAGSLAEDRLNFVRNRRAAQAGRGEGK